MCLATGGSVGYIWVSRYHHIKFKGCAFMTRRLADNTYKENNVMFEHSLFSRSYEFSCIRLQWSIMKEFWFSVDGVLSRVFDTLPSIRHPMRQRIDAVLLCRTNLLFREFRFPPSNSLDSWEKQNQMSCEYLFSKLLYENFGPSSLCIKILSIESSSIPPLTIKRVHTKTFIIHL